MDPNTFAMHFPKGFVKSQDIESSPEPRLTQLASKQTAIYAIEKP
jgi:hypothetical protein